jgi:hypothetical protein
MDRSRRSQVAGQTSKLAARRSNRYAALDTNCAGDAVCLEYLLKAQHSRAL